MFALRAGQVLVCRPSPTGGLNQYTNVDGATPVYDENGNITNDHRGWYIEYEGDNRLRNIYDGQGGTQLLRDRPWGDGTTRWQNILGVQSRYYFDGLDGAPTPSNQEIAETANVQAQNIIQNKVLKRYIRLPGSVDEPLLMITYNTSGVETGKQWAHANYLGSVVAVTDSAGAVVEQHTYSPYGESGGSTSGFPFRFTGQKLDDTTGLYYYKARYYDPVTGRFLQTDPVGYDDQMNLYAYVYNDPINNVDPTGRCGALIVHCLGAAGGAAAGLVGEVASVAMGNQASVGGFAGAIAGGAAAGAVFVQSGGNFAAAGATAGAVDSTVRQAVDGTIANGGDVVAGVASINVAEVGTETAIGAVAGKVPLPKIPGITAGRGSLSAVAKSQTTQLAGDTSRQLSTSTVGKIVANGALGDLPEASAAAVTGGIVDAVGDAAPDATLGNAANCALGASGCN